MADVELDVDYGDGATNAKPVQASPRFAVPARQPRSAPASQKMPELNLQNAYKVLQFYQNEPEWLADPRTSPVANADFAQASKIIGMSVQLERVNNATEAARSENIIGKQVATSLLKLAETGGARIAAKYYALDDSGVPRWKNPAEWENILNDYDNHTVRLGAEPASMTLEDGTVVQGWQDKKTGRFTQFIDRVGDAKELIAARSEASKGQITQRLEGAKELIGLRGEATKDQIQQRFDNQLALIDPRNAADIEKLREKHRLAMEFFDYKSANTVSSPAVLEKEVEYLRTLQDQKADPSLIAMVQKRIEFGKLRQGSASDVTVTTTSGDTKVQRKMSQSEFDRTQPPDETTKEQLEEYAVHKSNLASGDKRTGFGGDRSQKMEELKIKLTQKGWDPDTGKRIGVQSAPASQPSTNAPAANVTKGEYEKLKSGDLYWWNGKQIPKK